MGQWEQYFNAFYEQEKLEKYQKTRVLARPKTTKMTVFLYAMGLLILLAGVGIGLFVCLPLRWWENFSLFVLWNILMAETYGRLLARKIVECYQHYATEETRRRCKCVPSCSEYAILCLKKYELIRALRKIRKRLFVTCQGFDYIIDNP